MGLEDYREKRRFGRTPEPAGQAAPGDQKPAHGHGRRFVIHKHASRRLHYDLRLELDGVLLSWAVPKGPSLDPADKRLAVHVEDHPLEYGSFEGVIPAGEYGAGTVMVWDAGEWTPLEDAAGALAKGAVKFHLEGKKLRGNWTLVRMHDARWGEKGGGDPGEPGDAGGKTGGHENWLLIKERDDEVRAAEAGDILAEAPNSALTGRTMDEIAAAEAEEPADSVFDPSTVPGARKGGLPRQTEPSLATLVKEAPDGNEWLHEIKFDGYRILCRIQKGKVRLTSRANKDWTTRFPSAAAAAAGLPVRSALLDGEMVSLRPDGTTSFQDLQNALRDRREERLVYQVFDVLHLDGYDLTRVPLAVRKMLLKALLAARETAGPAAASLRYTDHIEGRGPAFFTQACKAGLEGIVSKRADGSYLAGRHRDWLKVKCVHQQEFVIGGYTEPAGSRAGFGALLVGTYDKDRLVFSGRVGTGFTERVLSDLTTRLKRLERATSPFAEPPQGVAARGVHWVKPTLVAQVRFAEWTKEGVLRQPSFLGLREDRSARQAVRETAAEKIVEVAGIRLTHPDKVLYPEQGITKRELALYCARIADWIMPHVAGRPLSVVRCPEGRKSECFYQKHAPEEFPGPVRAVTITERRGTADYIHIDSLPGLVALVQMGTLEIHTWGTRVDDVERPDRMIFDLDPGEGVPWEAIVIGARSLRDRLGDLGLTSFLKTTGGKGLHVVVPLTRRHTWDEVGAFAKAVAASVAAAEPDRYTATMSKAKRHGKIFIDYLRSVRGATAIAAYSTRARSDAPVSAPLRWEELGRIAGAHDIDLRSLPRRLGALKEDPWKDYWTARQSLTARACRTLGL